MQRNPPPPPDPEPGLTVHYELLGVQFEPGADIWGTMGNLVAQDDGKFLMSGVYESAEFPLGVAQVTRFDALGEVDVNFGNQGTVVADVGLAGGRDHAQDLMVQMVDGEARIVVVGRCDNYSSPWIARFLPNGLFDGSFGGDGKVDDILPDDSAGFMSLCVLSDGIIAAGRIQDSPTSLLLVKFLSDGSVDESFGNSGYSIINIGQEIHLMKGPVELDDGRLVAAGAGPNVQTSAIFMFTSDGSLDASFGNGGIAEIDLGAYEFFHDLAVQPDGKIVAVGATSNDAGAVYGVAESQRFTIARFNSDGSPDRKFARPKGGKELDLAAGGVGKFTSVKLLSDGRIIALGHGKPTPDIGSGDLYLARFQANGNFDTTFDEDGWINLDILGGEFSTGLVVLGDDSYIVGGNGGVPPAGVSLYLAAVWEEEE